MAEHAIQVTIGAKDEATKQIKEIDKQLAALTKKKATVSVDLSTDAAKKQMAELEEQLDKLQSEKSKIIVEANVKQALAALEDVSAEAKKAEAAAEALSGALGPELAGQADLGGIIADFRQMGLSLDDITANADQLGSKLREVGQRDVGGKLTTGFNRIGTQARSASGSASVLANSIGNATQDIGQIAGVSGTAGVAIGQMGEYMADAAFSGEKFGAVLANFGKVAGPVALLAATLQVVNNIMETFKKQAEEASKIKAFDVENAEMFAAAATEGKDAVKEYIDETRDVGKIELAPNVDDFNAALDAMGLMSGGLSEVSDNMRAVGKLKLHGIKDLTKDFEAAGIGAEEFFRASAPNNQRGFIALVDKIQKSNVSLNQQATLIAGLVYQQRLFATGAEDAATRLAVFGEAAKDNTDEMARMAKVYEATADALEKWADRTAKAFEDAQQAFIDIGDAQGAIDDMGSLFNQMARNSAAIGAAFDLGNAPLEALENIADINDAIRNLGKFIDKEGVPNIFDPNDVDAGPFLQQIAGMRGDIQRAVGEAFATGGPQKAQATADAYVKQIVDSMHGRLKAGDVTELLGLTAFIKVAVDQSSLAAAQQMLEILTGLQGETPWTASIKLALSAGEITAETAKKLIADRLKQLGIDVPTSLEAPDAKSKSAAKAEAERWAVDHPIDMAASVDSPDVAAVLLARDGGQAIADGLRPIKFKSTVLTPVLGRFDAGGRVPAAGGIAGEKGPEILDGRYLTTGPTYVPPGTRVTSRRRTTQILTTRGTRGLRAYDSGGTVPMGPVTVNFNGVGQMGNSFEIDRQLRKSMHRIQRIYGSR